MVSWMLTELELGATAAGAALTLAPGQTFNYGKRKNRVPDVTIPNGAKLAVNLQGKINYQAPQDPLADKPHFEVFTGGGCSNGKTVTVQNGGILQIGDPDVSAKTGTFHALKDAVVKVETGGILRISNASELRIYDGATLILEPGAIVRLDNPESKIRIEGKLVWNGDIVFQRAGYFEFAPGHELELNADALRLDGLASGHRFIEFDNCALSIPSNKGLNLRNGGVTYIGNSSISLEANAWTNNQYVKFSGVDLNGFGFAGTNVGHVEMLGCNFEDLSEPINLFGSTDFLSSKTIFKFCQFKNYQFGASFYERGGLLFDNCTFSSNWPSEWALYTEHNSITLLHNCNISGSSGLSTNNDDPLTSGNAAVEVVGGWVTWMDGGEIRNANIGIANRKINVENGFKFPTNIYMNNMATITDCNTGVAMNGNASTGLVAMDCARILNAKSCIRGTDIRLMIDPTIINPNGNQLRSNSFGIVLGQGAFPTTYLRICYDEMGAAPSNPIPAKKNYWAIGQGSTSVRNDFPQNNMAVTQMGCMTPVTVDVLGALKDFSACEAEKECDNDCEDECILPITNNSFTTVRQRYMDGMAKLRLENYGDAKSDFETVSNLWQPVLPASYTGICKSLVHASKSLATASGGGGPVFPRSSGQYDRAGGLKIQPNPSSQETMILLPSGMFVIQVYDGLGRLVHTDSANGNYRLDTALWPSGMYQVEAKAKDTGRLLHAKLMVSKLD